MAEKSMKLVSEDQLKALFETAKLEYQDSYWRVLGGPTITLPSKADPIDFQDENKPLTDPAAGIEVSDKAKAKSEDLTKKLDKAAKAAKSAEQITKSAENISNSGFWEYIENFKDMF